MTRPTRICLIAAIAAVGALTGTGQASAANDKAAGVFSATGGFSSSIKAAFVATSGPNGENAAGLATVESTFINIFNELTTMRGSGTVRCLFVNGNQAVIGIQLKKPVPFPIGILALSAQIVATDNGFAPAASPDQVGVGFSASPACEGGASGNAPDLTKKGDVVVRDATG